MKKKIHPMQLEKDVMFDLITNDLSLKEISDKHQISDRQIRNIRDKYNILHRLKPITEEEINRAINEHINGKLLSTVCKKYNISSTTVYNYIHSRNIIYKNHHGRKYYFDESYFENIDTEHKAYWLGFIYADGCIYKTNKTDKYPNRLSINISTNDIQLLKCLNKDLCSDIKIKTYIPQNTYANNSMSKVIYNSIKICSDLSSHGCSENKTVIPIHFHYASLKEFLYPHFIRGMFDGDGCITFDNCNNPHFQITGQPNFLNQVQDVLIDNCNLNKTKLIQYNDVNIPLADLKYGGKHIVQKIFNYLYKDATLYLERKYNKFLQI